MRRALVSAALLLGSVALPANPAGAQSEFETRLGETWRWRSLGRSEESPSFTSTRTWDGDRLAAIDAESLWLFDGRRWTSRPAWAGFRQSRLLMVEPMPGGTAIVTLTGAHVLVDDRVVSLAPSHQPFAITGGVVLSDGRLAVATPRGIETLGPDGPGPIIEPPEQDFAAAGVALDSDGQLWCTTRTGLWQLEDRGWSHRSTYGRQAATGTEKPLALHPPAWALEWGERLLFLPDFAGRDSPLLSWDGESVAELPMLPRPGYIDDALVTPDGHLLVAQREQGLWHFDGTEWRAAPLPSSFDISVRSMCLVGDRQLVLVGRAGRMEACDLRSTRWRIHDPETRGVSPLVNALAPSSRGGVWLATHHGVARWNGEEFTDVHLEAPALELSLDGVTAIAEDDDGRLWIGSGGAFPGALWYDDGRWHRDESQQGVRDGYVHAIRRGPDGELWFLLISGRTSDFYHGAIVRRSADGWTRWDEVDGEPMNRAYDLAWLPSGGIVAGTRAGLLELDGGRWRTLEGHPVDANSSAYAVHATPEGDLWIGHGKAAPGLWHRPAGQTSWEWHAGIAWRHAAAASFARLDGRTWFASESGFFVVDHDRALEVSADGVLRAPTFWPMLADDDGAGIWLGSLGAGLVHYRPDDDEPPETLAVDILDPRGDEPVARIRGADAWNVTPSDQLRFAWRLDAGAWSSPTAVHEVTLPPLGWGRHTFETRAFDLAGNAETQIHTSVFAVERPWFLRSFGLALSSVLVLTTVTLAIVLLRQRRERREAARAREELHDKLQSLAHQLLTSQEDERRRLSRDLHDDLGQLLTATCIHLKHAGRVEDHDRRMAALGRAHDTATAALDWVRSLSTHIRPTLLDDLGLEVAVTNSLSELRDSTGLDVHADLRFEREELPDPVSSHVFRILNECVTNVVRHARAQRLDVELHQTVESVRLSVTDDGVGFEPTSLSADDGLGLLGMRERAQSLGGSLEVRSSTGHGTSIRVSIPLQSEVERVRSETSWNPSESSSPTTTR